MDTSDLTPGTLEVIATAERAGYHFVTDDERVAKSMPPAAKEAAESIFKKIMKSKPGKFAKRRLLEMVVHASKTFAKSAGVGLGAGAAAILVGVVLGYLVKRLKQNGVVIYGDTTETNPDKIKKTAGSTVSLEDKMAEIRNRLGTGKRVNFDSKAKALIEEAIEILAQEPRVNEAFQDRNDATHEYLTEGLENLLSDVITNWRGWFDGDKLKSKMAEVLDRVAQVDPELARRLGRGQSPYDIKSVFQLQSLMDLNIGASLHETLDHPEGAYILRIPSGNLKQLRAWVKTSIFRIVDTGGDGSSTPGLLVEIVPKSFKPAQVDPDLA